MISSNVAKSKSTQTEHSSEARQTKQKNKGPIFNAFEPKSVQLAKPLKKRKIIKGDEEAENVPPEARGGLLEEKRNPQKKSRCNADVIKACENIMKKHNANEMKVMAK